MRKIKYIVVHTSATLQSSSIEQIKRYWRENLKWRDPGYHYIITSSGEIHKLLEESLPSNGVKGYNSQAINLCYIGGIDANKKAIDNRTDEQKAAILRLLTALRLKYPEAKILGHRDFPAVIKDCPCFDAAAEYACI